jgi:hypothetical protein
MQREALIRDGLLFALAQRYRDDPSQFLILSKQSRDSALMRRAIAQLRNDRHVEERAFGMIRLTPDGYRAFKNDPLPCSVSTM